MNNTSVESRADAETLDAHDPLGARRAAFDLPDGVVYLDGNSLGPPTRAALDRLARAAGDEWARGLIRSWNDANWIELPRKAGAKIARLIGASPEDVIVSDSVSANIFKIAGALLSERGGAVAVYANEFPTDGYILEGLSRLSGAPLRRIAAGEDPFARDARVLIVSAVDYRSARIADMAGLERQARDAGAAVIWDLSHATGLLNLDLAGAGARYAVGCGYKFLNGGPGAPAYLYVRNDAAEALRQPLSGWMGHAEPFAFRGDYHPAPGVARFACGTPPILSLAALDAALDIFEGLNLRDVEEKARRLGDLFLRRAPGMGLETASPPVGERRGGHVSLAYEHGYEVVQALIARNIIGDFRAPDLMRFGFSPLYLRYVDVWDAADALQDVLDTEEWRKPEFAARRAVT